VKASFADTGGHPALANLIAQNLTAVAAVGGKLIRVVSLGDEPVEQRKKIGPLVFIAGA
jgi:hypothetical protein